MLQALSLAFGQLSDPRIQKLILISILFAVATFAGLYFAADYAFSAFFNVDGWLGALLSGAGTFLFAWFTFPIVMATFAALFADQVIDAVMARHYPGRAMPFKVSILEMVLDGLKLAGIAFVANVLTLPLLFFPPVYACVAYGVNGYLLGREYYEMPAFRRLPRAEAKALFERRRAKFVLAGVGIAFLGTIPFLNLIAPVIGIAFMVHIFESVVNLEPRPARIN
ncbi:EI24 domain-containing protein [Dongia sp.]|uniref:EI24 domain-containing protein n=1 Tax=Dongia sp. TaxID=1977262 RepID=UPI0035B33F91